MNWTNQEIDDLFREGAKRMSFEYKKDYFKDIEVQLPIKRKPDVLWMITALFFIAGLGTASWLTLQNENTMVNKLSHARTTIVSSEMTAALSVENRLKTEAITTKTENGITGESGVFVTKLQQIGEPAADVTVQNKTVENPLTIEMPQNGVAMSSEDQPVAGINEEISAWLSVVSPDPLDLTGLSQNLAVAGFAGVQTSSKSLLYLEFNSSLSQSYVTPAEGISTSFGIGLGIELNMGRWTFTAGVNGTVSNHSDLLLNRQGKIYGFGSRSSSYELIFKNLYAFETAFSAGFNLGRHRMIAGVRPSYIISSKVVLRLLNNEMSRNKVNYGFMEGLNRFGVRPMMGYSYSFKGGWTLGANVGVQLRPLVGPEFIQVENNSFPIDGQLYLRRLLRFRN